MKVKSIFVNLPIKDLKKARDFWTKLGFSFNEQFSNDKALCLVLNEGKIYSMLITNETFNTFTNRPIADGTTTQVLTAIEVDSREQVDKIVHLALENGATRYRECADHGWMYYDCFADLDGHQWEIMFTDPTGSLPDEKPSVVAMIRQSSLSESCKTAYPLMVRTKRNLLDSD